MANSTQIYERRARVAQLRLVGKSMAAIAAELGVSHTTIVRDVRVIKERQALALDDWIAERIRQYDVLDGMLLDGLDISNLTDDQRLRHKAALDNQRHKFAGGERHDPVDAKTLIKTMRSNADWLESQLTEDTDAPSND